MITLSLMVLLTIISVGLLSLSSISLRSSERGDAMATARANAKMAMVLAIGELQKEAGPDQRATGTADLAGAADGSALSAGASPGNNVPLGGTTKGLTAVQPGTRYWTGVWNNSNTTNPGTTIYTRTPTPAFRKWLVSGNQGSATGNSDFTPATSSLAVGSSGSIDIDSGVVLVGKGSVGESSANSVDRYVTAPIVKIEAEGTSARYPAGRQAWWIGDEGVKAKINMSPSTSGSDNDLTYERLVGPRRGWETVAGFDNYPVPGGGGEEDLMKVVTLPEAALMDGSLAEGGSPALDAAFHSATTESFGVLTDALQGGLRLDLSNYLNQTVPSSSPSPVINGIASNANIIPISIAPRIKGPKWSALKKFRDLGQSLHAEGRVTVKAATLEEPAIGPAIVDFRLLMGVKATLTAANTYKFQPCVKIAVTLANPYPYPLQWSSPLDLEVKNVTATNQIPSSIYDAPSRPAYLSYQNQPAVLYNAIFRVPSTTLPPGEARAFTITGPVQRPLGSTAKINIDLGTFSGSTATNFENSVILDTASLKTFTPTDTTVNLDVRESDTTSQITVELRTSGSSNAIIRRLERFELDNSNYSTTAHQMTTAALAQYPKPFPLQFYGFQMSQPGVDYANLLPAANQLGLRGSTLRTYTDFNVHATYFRKSIISYNPPPYFMTIANSPGTLGFTTPGGQTGSEFTKNLLLSPLPWGHSPFTSRKTVLFSPPETLVSLAQFQHADLTADDLYVSVGHQPGNAMGNSYASPFIPRANTIRNRQDFVITSQSGATPTSTNYYDLSYLLNAALWDTYFFSTLPGTGPSVPLNRSMVKIRPNDTSDDLKDGAMAASRLLVNGAQNVNCTEKDAWKALFASAKHLQHKADAGSSPDAMFPRSIDQPVAGTSSPTGSAEDSFAGFRRLNDDQIDALATEIVKQVRVRGPFVSLSQFVNRSLAALSVAQAPIGRAGPLQAAIDAAGLNTHPDGTKTIFGSTYNLAQDKVNLQFQGSAPSADMAGGRPTTIPNNGTDGTWPNSSLDLNPGSVAGILADRPMLIDPRYKKEQGFRSTGIPGWLTQADVLQVIGPALTVRSDTFRIRAYGEATDPNTGTPIAKAWCEAVVQRMPDYVDGSDLVSDLPDQLIPVNQKFGRRFNTVSFKWLSPNEI